MAAFGQPAKAAPAAYLDWVVFAPGGVQAWSARAPLVMTVSMGAAPATHLLARSTLMEEQTNQLFGGGVLTVCSKPFLTDCGPVAEVAAGQPVQLYLHPKYPPAPGKYTGTVQLFAAEGRSEPATVTVYVTSGLWKFWGLIALALGLAASAILTVGVRNGLQRAQLLAPANTLEDAFADLEARLPSQSDRVEQTRDTIRAWRENLSTRQLEAAGYVPRRFAVAAATIDKAAAYQDWLNRGSAAASALDRLLGGFQALAAAERALPDDADHLVRSTVEAAWSEIDALSANARSDLPNAVVIPEVDAAIAGVLTQLRRRVSQPSADLLLPPLRRKSERIRFQISSYSLATWLFVALITFVVGAYALVLARPEFGRVQDYVVSFLWAFALPSAAAQLAQLSPSSLAASMGVARPTSG
ncbi:hypothetical protein LJR219_004165 [Phenylobacterium sp. LjRoot219]|uniref:hypothetical protein n=1 Tax=Phenylobacterium sp. LjRoot219 TaxID=3342283 RepID=UPI003ECE5317